MSGNILSAVLLVPLLIIPGCRRSEQHWKVIPASFVYSIVQRDDSLYISTRSGETFRMHPDNPDAITRTGLRHFFPLRTLRFLSDGTLIAGSYEGGVYRVHSDTLTLLPGAMRPSWSMCTDNSNRIWLAGKQGIFILADDTLIRFSDLHEAYDVEFHRGHLAVAHRHGITLYDTSNANAVRTYGRDTIFWSLDRFDSLLVCGGVESCLLISDTIPTAIHVGPPGNIPWAAAMDAYGTIFLGTQQGLYSVTINSRNARRIGYAGKCIKSVLVDRKGRLWVGEYFNRQR